MAVIDFPSVGTQRTPPLVVGGPTIEHFEDISQSALGKRSGRLSSSALAGRMTGFLRFFPFTTDAWSQEHLLALENFFDEMWDLVSLDNHTILPIQTFEYLEGTETKPFFPTPPVVPSTLTVTGQALETGLWTTTFSASLTGANALAKGMFLNMAVEGEDRLVKVRSVPATNKAVLSPYHKTATGSAVKRATTLTVYADLDQPQPVVIRSRGVRNPEHIFPFLERTYT